MAVPGQVDVRVTSVTSSSVSVIWSRVEANPAITHYEVSTDNINWTRLRAGVTSYFLGSLQSVYRFYVRAVNSEGAGSITVVSGPTTSNAERPPIPIPSVWAGSITDTSIQILWSELQIPQYRVLRYEVSSDNTNWVSAGTARNYVFDSLQPGTEYDYYVRAVNAWGNSISKVVTVSTTIGPPGKPGTPSVRNRTSTSFDVDWSRGNVLRGRVTRWEISNDDGATWITAITITNQLTVSLTYKYDNLESETEYQVRVRAINLQGTGPQSDVLIVTTLPALPTPSTTTVTFSGEPTTTQTSSYTTSLVFSNAIAGLTSRDFRLLDADDSVVRNASISVAPSTPGSKTNFTLTIAPPSNYNGVIKVELLANSVNLDGQSSQTLPATAQTSAEVTIDNRLATFNVFNFGITLTGETQLTSQWEPMLVEGFTLADITVSDSNVVLSNLMKFDPIGDGSLIFYTFDVTPPANAVGSFTLSVAENILTDPPRNSAYTSAAFSYDTRPDETPPTLTWNEPTAIQGGAFNLPLNFSEPVLGLTQDDFSASSGATISYTGVSGAIETPIITITPTDGQTGSIVVTLRENAVTDMAGNSNVESSSLPIRFDTQNPHVITWQYPALLPVIETPINVTTIFNEPVALNRSLVSIVATLSDGATETLLFNKIPAGSVSTAIHSFMITTLPEEAAGTILITIQAGAAIDSINNRNEEITSQTIAFDTQPDARFERGLHIVKVEVPDGINTETTATARVFFNKAPVGSPEAQDFRLDGLASAQIMSVLPVMDNPVAFDVLISRDINDSGLLKIELEI